MEENKTGRLNLAWVKSFMRNYPGWQTGALLGIILCVVILLSNLMSTIYVASATSRHRYGAGGLFVDN